MAAAGKWQSAAGARAEFDRISQFPRNKLRIVEKLGDGAFGMVRRPKECAVESDFDTVRFFLFLSTPILQYFLL